LLKKRPTYFDQNNCQARKYFTLTKTLAEKVRLLLLPKLLPRKDEPILETLQSQPGTPLIKKTTCPIKTKVDRNAN
jgi:hypothetical protein